MQFRNGPTKTADISESVGFLEELLIGLHHGRLRGRSTERKGNLSISREL
jgi:hypothetical protein